MAKPKIIVSGINMVEGGIFTVLDACLHSFNKINFDNDFEIIALVNNKSIFDYPNISFLEFPKSKKYWFLRFYYEYFYFKQLSKKLRPDIWLSLHDMTPNVVCEMQFVYCHNPNMFYKSTIKDWFFDYKMGIFGLFYKYLYQINIKKNNVVFVQQDWIKSRFENEFGIENVIVSQPFFDFINEVKSTNLELDSNKIHFFYPSFPRTFKNFELIFEAVLLLDKNISDKICVHITLDKLSENRYLKFLIKKYGHIAQVNFTGLLSKTQMISFYKAIDCLVFPSKLETWGLPISEAKFFEKSMFLANLPYAKETVGCYKKVSFFDVENPQELAVLIADFVCQNIVFDGNISKVNETKKLVGWAELFDFMLKK
ncbi:MAG: hypothetical protein RLZZ312_1720 [Bacteroidota bacterium]